MKSINSKTSLHRNKNRTCECNNNPNKGCWIAVRNSRKLRVVDSLICKKQYLELEGL